MIIKKLLPILVIMILALVACSNDTEKITKVPEIKEFQSLKFQKIVKNNEVEDETKEIKDAAKTQEILKLVDGLKTKEQNITDTEAEMKKVDSYFFYFENKKERDPEKPIPYSVFITEDGRIFFTHSDIDELMVPQRSVEKHPEILEQIKEIAEIK